MNDSAAKVDRVSSSGSRRPALARIGISALNLPAPGLGLVRIGKTKLGLACLVAPLAFICLLALAAALLPTPTSTIWLVIMAATVVVAAACYMVPLVLTWRHSKVVVARRWWARWYGLVAIYLIVLLLTLVCTEAADRYYKKFYAVAASMAPTLLEGDHLLVDMRDTGRSKRGEIVVFDAPHGQWIKRVVAVGGDRITVRDGVPLLNGQPATRRASGQMSVTMDVRRTGTVFEERLPGTQASYRVVDVGPSMLDDFPERTVPAGHFFAMGDHRDNSMDSRLDAAQGGVGMVPDAKIVGRPLFVYWRNGGIERGSRLNSAGG